MAKENGVKDFDKYLNVSKAINSTFGQSGKGQKIHKMTENVKLIPLNETEIKGQFVTIVSFDSNSSHEMMIKKSKEQGLEMFKSALKQVSEFYEKNFGEKLVLKLENESLVDSVEIVSNNNYVKRGFYRLNCRISVK